MNPPGRLDEGRGVSGSVSAVTGEPLRHCVGNRHYVRLG
jgi:hypothetical protein